MAATSTPCGDIVEIRKVPNKEYVYTERSFTKRELLPQQLQVGPDGQPRPWRWGNQRLRNEANASPLVGSRTNILIPRLLDSGVDAEGRTYITMERMFGISLEKAGEQCRMPLSGQRAHVPSGECVHCANIAYANVDRYITTTVFPQLQQLKSNTTGLDGFGLPPPRITETVHGSILLEPITVNTDAFCLNYGDLARLGLDF